MRARVVIVALLLLADCRREARRWDDPPPAPAPDDIAMPTLHAGATPSRQPTPLAYDENAWAVSEGKLLYEAFNCVGCHSHGGGGMGPPLMDDKWIYGKDPENIFQTIVEGRPNGMPSFRDKIAAHDLWKIVAYVRSLGGLLDNKQVTSARDEHLQATPPQPLEPGQTPTREAPDRP